MTWHMVGPRVADVAANVVVRRVVLPIVDAESIKWHVSAVVFVVENVIIHTMSFKLHNKIYIYIKLPF